MRSTVPFFGLFILGFVLFMAWLNSYVLARWFPVYRSRAGRYGYWLITVFSCLIASYMWVMRPPAVADYDAFRAMAYASFVWIIGQLVLTIGLPLIYMLHRLTRKKEATDLPGAGGGQALSRRTFLKSAVAVTPVLAYGLAAKGVVEAELTMAVKRYDLTFADLPAALDGFKIVQISDIHLGPYVSLGRLEQVLTMVRTEKPDLLVVTGDFVDDLSLLSPAFKQLNAVSREVPHGAYFCWGNHEYFRDISRVRAELNASPVHLLENRSALIIGGEHPFYLLGVDYPWARDAQGRQAVCRQLFDETRRDVPDGAFSVLIAHHPDFITEAFDNGVPLTLSGHTHGGQIALFGRALVPLNYKYMLGMYQNGAGYGYVSAGTGHWFPFRLGCPPEIGVFRLSRG